MGGRSQSVLRRRVEFSRSSRAMVGFMLLASCACLSATIRAFQAGPDAFVPTGASANSLQTRRALLGAALSSGALLLPGAEPVFAEETKAPPQAIFLSGRRGPQADRFNGKWTVVLGQKMNGKPVYKRNGEGLYLVLNNCGQFMIDSRITGECGGLATNTKEGWKFGDEVDSKVKVRPLKPGEEPQEDEAAANKAEVRAAVQSELALMEREGMVEGFSGKLSDSDEAIGSRLMAKFGVSEVVGR
mmetsp:Transcript_6369/g.13916  ORF Transcript_6369/g.13916 Transcript_6369/m.13916 type:complete len:244 (+) Transcript_6369:80-811(+)|eukprot:CAMPEP_0178420076 /NCGR_PEP_ID=MMETSP0689_2-20121128/25942_1 /TAXON_ID=160604 /ORGANISM="Amphidinium massartii, Strain CS-259" /LENGTH=243 /DNA_ID=CAMNT_0020041539 /DNA_START=74 /DNA_END=805 /DNA_ORIENTATION=+